MVSRDLCFYPVGVTLDLADATIPLCLRMANRLELMRMRVEEGLGRMSWMCRGVDKSRSEKGERATCVVNLQFEPPRQDEIST